MGLMGKSKAFALYVVGNPIWQQVGDYFLTSKLQHCWVSIVSDGFSDFHLIRSIIRSVISRSTVLLNRN
jgi:hypothetical protein